MGKKGQAKGAGHLFKRGRVYYIQYTVNGKRIVQSLKTTDKTVAQKLANEKAALTSEVTNRELTVLKIAEAKNIVSNNRIKVDEIWEKFLNEPSRPDSSANTLKSYKSAVNLFSEWLTKHHPSARYIAQVTDATGADFANFLWQEHKVSERTYNAYIKALFLIFRVLNKDIRNPFAKENISRKNENQQGRYKFTEQEIDKVLNIFADTGLKTMYKDQMEILFYIGAFTGLRLIDCCFLKWKDIHLEQKIIKTIPEKTKRIKRHAVIPLTTQLEDKLKVAVEWKRDAYVLPDVADRYKRNPDGIRKDIIKILNYTGFNTTEESDSLQRKKNICRYGFHSFRHTYASLMASRGYNINMLAKVLADDTKTLEKYYINIDDKVIKDTFNDLMGGSGKNNIKSEIISRLDYLSELELNSVMSLIKSMT